MQPQEGLKVWRNPLNGFLVIQTHYTADAKRRGDWKYRASPKYGGLKAWKWRKEMEIDWEAQSGKLVFENWNPKVHQIRPFTIPAHWPRWILIDPGWTNPTSMVWMAVDADSAPDRFGYRPVHIYREFYRSRHSAAQIAAIASDWSMTAADERGQRTHEWIEAIIIDPGARQEHQGAQDGDHVGEAAQTFLTLFEERVMELGWRVPIETGNNLKDAAIEEAITRLGCFWMSGEGVPLYDDAMDYREPSLEELAAGAEPVKPTLFFHHSCIDGAREMAKYRWKDWSSGEVRERRNEQERPVDKDDHTITNVIRGLNLLRTLRVENGPDLSAFEGRARPARWVPDEDVVQQRHQQLARRHRRRQRRRDAL